MKKVNINICLFITKLEKSVHSGEGEGLLTLHNMSLASTQIASQFPGYLNEHPLLELTFCKLITLIYQIDQSLKFDQCTTSCCFELLQNKKNVGVLLPTQQPGSYWDRSSALPCMELEPTEVTVYG